MVYLSARRVDRRLKGPGTGLGEALRVATGMAAGGGEAGNEYVMNDAASGRRLASAFSHPARERGVEWPHDGRGQGRPRGGTGDRSPGFRRDHL